LTLRSFTPQRSTRLHWINSALETTTMRQWDQVPPRVAEYLLTAVCKRLHSHHLAEKQRKPTGSGTHTDKDSHTKNSMRKREAAHSPIEAHEEKLTHKLAAIRSLLLQQCECFRRSTHSLFGRAHVCMPVCLCACVCVCVCVCVCLCMHVCVRVFVVRFCVHHRSHAL
jgi:hypothetical protein